MAVFISELNLKWGSPGRELGMFFLVTEDENPSPWGNQVLLEHSLKQAWNRTEAATS